VSANTLENVCENMLTHVHKVIHLVVGTFNQGWQSGSRGGAIFHLSDSGPEVTGLEGEHLVIYSSEECGFGL
jgi:hypothetical protein